VDARPAWQTGRLTTHRPDVVRELGGIASRLLFRADHRAEPSHVAQNALDRAVVADPHLDATTDQRLGDVGLDVGEADRKIRSEPEDPIDLRAGERRPPRLLPAGVRRTDREAGDADDAMLLTERVEHLGGFFGQADDALWEHQPSIAAPADARHRLRPARVRSPAPASDPCNVRGRPKPFPPRQPAPTRSPLHPPPLFSPP